MPLSPIEVLRRFQQGLNAYDLSVIDRYVASTFVSYVPGIPNNKSEWKMALMEEINAYEEEFCIIDDIYLEGDRVYLQMTEEYRQTAPFRGDYVDSRRCRMTTVNPYQVENGLITAIYPSTIIRYEEFA